MPFLFYQDIRPEEFQGTYQKVSEALHDLGDSPMEGLLDRIKQAETIRIWWLQPDLNRCYQVENLAS